MSREDVARAQSIASLRIHVERAINKIKNFHIWDSVVPFTLFGVVNQMCVASCFLCQNSIISTFKLYLNIACIFKPSTSIHK